MNDPETANYEDIRAYTLDDSTERELLEAQNELTFSWSTKDGWPVGVIMSYVFKDGRFWCTTGAQRKRVAALRRDPRVSVVVTSKGSRLEEKGRGAADSHNKALNYKGRCILHDDAETKAWFYPALSRAINVDAPERMERFAELLDTARRIIFEIVPEFRIGYDGAKLRAAEERSGVFAQRDDPS
jgi:Pyridoxamine 5'-phosphate oxidase